MTRLDTMSSAQTEEVFVGKEKEGVDLFLDDVKVAVEFDTYEEAINFILKWCGCNYFPLIKRSTIPGKLGTEGTPGRIQFYCTRDLKKKWKATSVIKITDVQSYTDQFFNVNQLFLK